MDRRSFILSHTQRRSGQPLLKMFVAALCFTTFSRALCSSYMESAVTQLERRFHIPSDRTAIIDGSFQLGNLLLLIFVSYFGAKLHRPKVMAVGITLMSLGTFLISMPHFLVGRMEPSVGPPVNSTLQLQPCPAGSSRSAEPTPPSAGCEGDSRVSMWIYVLLGNVLRGVGETPLYPLGLSFIDDHAHTENAALYIGGVHSVAIIGHVSGQLLGTLCTKLYVDVGQVDMKAVGVAPADPRWVGAWWLGLLVSGLLTLSSAVPFWFLPKSVEMHKLGVGEPANLRLMFNELLPALKSLVGNRFYVLYLCVSVLQHSSAIGMQTYQPTYMEQHYGQSASRTQVLTGVTTVPAVVLGLFFGGVVMKKCALGVMAAARFSLCSSVLGYFLSLLFFAVGCENLRVAGVTVSYTGAEGVSGGEASLVSPCNAGCSCPGSDWDPVCGQNGLTYVSPCWAGCSSSSGSDTETVFHSCSCVSEAMPSGGNPTAVPGQCPDRGGCDRVLPHYLLLSLLSSFITALGGTPGFMLLLRCVRPELKSLALGIQTLATRALAEVPAPVYFGAAIDSTCLKWGGRWCGGASACRIYQRSSFRVVYLGLTLGLRTASFFFCGLGLRLLKQHLKSEARKSLSSGGSSEAAFPCDGGVGHAHMETPL